MSVCSGSVVGYMLETRMLTIIRLPLPRPCRYAENQDYRMPGEIEVLVHYEDELPPKTIVVKVIGYTDRGREEVRGSRFDTPNPVVYVWCTQIILCREVCSV